MPFQTVSPSVDGQMDRGAPEARGLWCGGSRAVRPVRWPRPVIAGRTASPLTAISLPVSFANAVPLVTLSRRPWLRGGPD